MFAESIRLPEVNEPHHQRQPAQRQRDERASPTPGLTTEGRKTRITPFTLRATIPLYSSLAPNHSLIPPTLAQ